MVRIHDGGEPEKVPLTYYNEYGERFVVGEAAVQIKDGEVVVVGKLTQRNDPLESGDSMDSLVTNGVNLEAFSISAGPFLDFPLTPAEEAARRLGPMSLEHKIHVTDSNPNGEVRQCDRRDLHEPHEYEAKFGDFFYVYCPGNEGSKR